MPKAVIKIDELKGVKAYGISSAISQLNVQAIPFVALPFV